MKDGVVATDEKQSSQRALQDQLAAMKLGDLSKMPLSALATFLVQANEKCWERRGRSKADQAIYGAWVDRRAAVFREFEKRDRVDAERKMGVRHD